MLKNVFTLCLVLTAATVARADLETARKAFETGDYKTALAELLPLAETGNAKAQSNLGWMYRNGVGVTQNHTEAVKWFRKAAGQGDAPGQYNLGLMYEEGFGVKQDYAEAAKWYRQAAEQGQANAQFNLAEMYLDGLGVDQDYVQAYAWISVVATGGAESAQFLLDEIEVEMDLEQIDTASKLARQLWKKYGSHTGQ